MECSHTRGDENAIFQNDVLFLSIFSIFYFIILCATNVVYISLFWEIIFLLKINKNYYLKLTKKGLSLNETPSLGKQIYFLNHLIQITYPDNPLQNIFYLFELSCVLPSPDAIFVLQSPPDTFRSVHRLF